DVAAEATASPRSWGADDMLWKLRLGSASGRGGSQAAPHPGRVRSGVVDQSCTRARTPAPMVPVVVIVAIETAAFAGNAPARVAKMAWMFGMGRHQYRTMMQRVKAQFDCIRNHRRKGRCRRGGSQPAIGSPMVVTHAPHCASSVFTTVMRGRPA